jgi:PTH1 family peptidyl-tRNA hydrolase
MLTYLIAGLGNPGNQYRTTRHNIGFLVLDGLKERLEIRFRKGPGNYEWVSSHFGVSEMVLLKPMTFMNRSGIAIADAQRRLKIPVEQILVILDDLALPLGRLRLRQAGSHGGHKGLASICRYLHSEAVPRLRIGIGKNPEEDAVRFVLSPFSDASLPAVEQMIEKAGQAACDFVSHGIQYTMNAVNSSE